MSAEAAALSRTWSVGRYTVTLTVPPLRPAGVLNAVVEWSPSVPAKLTPDELEQYRAGRDDAIRALGVRALVVDL
jgi:hypothetical protein